jgi:ankyrin repeat protein
MKRKLAPETNTLNKKVKFPQENKNISSILLELEQKYLNGIKIHNLLKQLSVEDVTSFKSKLFEVAEAYPLNNMFLFAALFGDIGLFKYIARMKGIDVKAVDTQGINVLHMAAINGNLELFKYISETQNINVKAVTSCEEYNVLHMAAINGNLELFKYIAETQNIDVKAVTLNWEYNVLHLAVKHGNIDLFKYIIAKIKGIEKESDPYEAVHNLQHLAVKYGHIDLFKYIVKTLDIDLNITTNDDYNLLHRAAGSGNTELFKHIAEMKGINLDVNAETESQHNILDLAAISGNLELCKYIVAEIKGLDVKKILSYCDDENTLSLAAESGNLELFKYIKGLHHDFNLETANKYVLPSAVRSGNLELCKYIVTQLKDVDVTKVLSYDNTLSLAAISGNLELFKYIEGVYHAFNLKTVIDNSSGLLYKVASGGHLELFKYIVETQNIDVTAVDERGYNVLHQVIESENLELCKYIVAVLKGVDVKKLLSYGYNFTLSLAAISGNLELFKYIERVHHDFNLKTVSKSLPFKTASYIAGRKGIDVTEVGKNGFDVLYLAVKSGNLELIDYIVKTTAIKISDSDIIMYKDKDSFSLSKEYFTDEIANTIFVINYLAKISSDHVQKGVIIDKEISSSKSKSINLCTSYQGITSLEQLQELNDFMIKVEAVDLPYIIQKGIKIHKEIF